MSWLRLVRLRAGGILAHVDVQHRPARADERAAEEAERARKRAEKQAYADKQARKRVALKALREQRGDE